MKQTKLLLTILLSMTAAHLYAADISLDLRPQKNGGVLLAAQPQTDGTIRETRLDAGATKTDTLKVGDTISLQLFDNISVKLTLAEQTESPLGGTSFLAEVTGYDGIKNAVVLQTAEGLQVDIQDFQNGKVYTVFSTATATSVKEISPETEAVAHCDTLVPELPAEPAAPQAKTLAATIDQSSTVVDMLVAYDSAATVYAMRNGGITNFANMAVQKMNTALGNSGLSANFRFRLVGVTTVNVSAADVHSALYAIRDNQTGWAAIKTKRDEVGADIVSTLIDTGSSSGNTGVGWSLETTSFASFSESAYNVCAVRAVAQGHTMTHEVGHNMGAGHATAVADENNRGPQLYSYSSGYYFTGTDNKAYHTIMAYNTDGYGNTYASAPLFSSPDYMWAGVPAGDETHNNALTINNTFAAATKWRSQKVALSYDVFFSPESGATFDDSMTVTLTPGKSDLQIYYTLDGTTPTTASTLYTGPIVISDTTTIRAIAVTFGVPGMIYEATYSVRDLGTGVDAPQLEWTTSSDYPWTFQTTNTYDSVDAVQSGEIPSGTYGKESWLKTTVTGPTTMSFRYCKTMAYSTFAVRSDSKTLFYDSSSGLKTDWVLVEVDIPSGTHEIKFTYTKGGQYTGLFNGILLDTVRFDALSRPPTISPETTTEESTATVFNGNMTVTITPPVDHEGTIFYTVDRSDPAGESGIAYTGPFQITASTLVKAVFVEGGKDPSVAAEGLFLERHPIQPGEWTTDVNGAKTAAAINGKLTCVLQANLETCGWTKAFTPIAESPEFLAWARANGIYLITADASRYVDADAADQYFWTLYNSYGSNEGVPYPTMYFALPSDPDTAVDKGLARNDGYSTIGTELYLDTAQSLIAGFASVLQETALPAAPTATPETSLVDSFPISVTLANPNANGDIFYTLDGTAPTRSNGTRYTGAISIPNSGMSLQAAVWTDSALSSPILIRQYKTIADVFGTKGVVWTTGGDYKWVEDTASGGTLRTPYVENTQYSSWLKATVSGKGKLIFVLKGVSYSSANKIVVKKNSSQIYSYGYSSTNGTSKTVMLTSEVTSEGTTDFLWTYTIGSPASNYSVCGAWLADVKWIPESKATEQGVPYAWLDTTFTSSTARDAAAYEALAAEDYDGDGFANWAEYVCGTNPKAKSERPQCNIAMRGDEPEVSHNINIPDEAIEFGWKLYLKGSTDLKNWHTANPATDTFFKATVELVK
ncbi:MAG: chitobiase/beta-hexosaminidase C-terminal domain-containing protein [Kiritimatiellae bacterium]|nr:chitobiase/beta-hexosaminidase C-terminal domain-containing protein [Kiritimatiellia bacterium]